MNGLKILGLDVGERRLGVAVGDSSVRLAYPLTTILVDGHELENIQKIITEQAIQKIVIGYPRNQAGETTQQTVFVEEFAQRLKSISHQLIFQDESLTSVLAEQQLKNHKKPYTKEDIDAWAAKLILQDYLDQLERKIDAN